MIRSTLRVTLMMATFVSLTVSLSAQNLSGPHYNLNIIGVDKTKTATMTNSDRHTIFVALGGKDGATVSSTIWLRPGFDFQVCDGNGFDAAYDCNGVPFKNQGATFQLPCNTYLTYSADLGCPTDVAQRSYVVWARALGKPGGNASMMTCATDTTTMEQVCSTDNVLTLKRGTGKSVWQDATSQLTSLEADVNGDGVLDTVALFADGLTDFFWQYDNQGLKHAQVRFYPLVP
jgi:hypothetical protein